MTEPRPENPRRKIKPRQLSLELSDDEVKQLFALAYKNGTTPANVLTGFICDLTGGERARGTDESDLAQQYFNRCRYDLGMRHTFLSWALQRGCIEEIEQRITCILFARDKAIYNHKGEKINVPDFLQRFSEEQAAAAEQEIKDFYREYREEQEQRQEPAQELEKGLKNIRAYMHELDRLDAW